MNTEQIAVAKKLPKVEAAEEMTALTDGTAIIVTKKDGSTESVKVLDLAVEKLPDLLAGLNDMPLQIEIYCGKEKGWAAQLTKQSQREVATLGDKVNMDFFDWWLGRQTAWADKLAVAAKLISIIQPLVNSSRTARPGAS